MSLPSYSFGAEGVEFGRNSAYYALAGTGGGDGVTEIIAGSNITISPLNGQGAVTINATGGSGGVSSVTASGAGITATPTSGAVVVANTGVTSVSVSGPGLTASTPSGAVSFTNTGVTSLVAGVGVSVSAASGAVTVSNTASSGTAPSSGVINYTGQSGNFTLPENVNAINGVFMNFSIAQNDTFLFGLNLSRKTGADPWSSNDLFFVILRKYPLVPTDTYGPIQRFDCDFNSTTEELTITGSFLGTFNPNTQPYTQGPLIQVMRVKGAL
jgi:hypothetical protein